MNSKLIAIISIIIMIGIIISFICSIILENRLISNYGFSEGSFLLIILAIIDSRRR